MNDITKARFTAFIKQVLINERNSYFKKNYSRQTDTLPDASDAAYLPETLIHRDVHHFIEKDRINSLLAGLKDTDRDVLVLRVICDFSAREVAVMLGIKEKSVRQKLYRAKERLRKKIEEDIGNE